MKEGLADITKEDIVYHQELRYQNKQIQVHLAKMKTRIREMVIIALYWPLRYDMTKQQYFEFLNIQGYRYMIEGDYNAKGSQWGSRLIRTKGKELLKANNQSRSEIVSTGLPIPSDPNTISDLIQYFVIENISMSY